MLTIKTKINRLAFLSLILISILLQGCITGENECPIKNGSEDGAVLQFTVITKRANAPQNDTRALIEPTNPQIGTVDENYLDLDNLVFLLYDNNRTLIQTLYPEVHSVPNTEYVKYTVKARINHPYFLNAPGPELSFYILVVGNYSLLNPTNTSFSGTTALQNLFSPDIVAGFEMPKRIGYEAYWKPNCDDDKYDGNKAYIPMSGLQHFTVSVAQLQQSTAEQPLQLSEGVQGKEVNMLRALAKIEIVDRINASGTGSSTIQPGIEERAFVEKAELMGYFSRGSLLPAFEDWNKGSSLETQYAASPSIPNDARFVSIPPQSDELEVSQENARNVINFFYDEEATARREDKCRVFSCYLTEYDASRLTSGQAPMWIRTTVQNKNNTAQSILYRILVAPYSNGTAGSPMDIVRNNIYRYEILSVSSQLQLNWTVCNMDTGVANIEFN